jgi:hypothetical protein
LKRTNARTAALIVCLGVLALLLGSVNAGLSAPLYQLEQGLPRIASLVVSTHTETIETGAILVNASLYEGALGVSPVANATVKIVLDAQGFLPLLLETNSSGEAQAQIDIGNYTLTVSSQFFSSTSQVRVYENATTEADVAVRMISNQVLFADLSDVDSSGYVAPWQSIVVAVNASSRIANSSVFLLYLSPPQGEALLAGPDRSGQVPVTVVASQVRGSGSSGLLWLTMHPGTFLPLQGGLTAFAVVTYTASTGITFHGR